MAMECGQIAEAAVVDGDVNENTEKWIKVDSIEDIIKFINELPDDEEIIITVQCTVEKGGEDGRI